MADLKIPNININSNKYIFKKKLSLRRKSKKRIFTEALLLFILSLLLVYLNYLIPNKYLLIQNLPISLNKLFILTIGLFSNLYKICLIIFIFVSSLISLLLMIGSFNRIFRVIKRNSKQIIYK